MSDAIRITRRSDGKYLVEGIGPTTEIYDGASTLARTIEIAVQTLQPPSLITRLRAMGIRPEHEKEALSELTARRSISLRDEVLAVLPAEHPEWFDPNAKPEAARPLISEIAEATMFKLPSRVAHAAPEEPPTFKIAPPPAASDPVASAPEPESLPWKERLNALTMQKNPQGDFVLTGPNTYKVIPVGAALHGDTLLHDMMAVVQQLQSEPDDEDYEFTPIPARIENQAERIGSLSARLKNFEGVHISRDLDDRIIKVRLEGTAPSMRLVTEHLDETLKTNREGMQPYSAFPGAMPFWKDLTGEEAGADSKTPAAGRVSNCEECAQARALLLRAGERLQTSRLAIKELQGQIEDVRRDMREELDAAAARLSEEKRRTAMEESRRKVYGGYFERVRYCIIGEGPEEFFRWTAALKKADRKIAETWIYYLMSLWSERDKLRSELNRFKEGDLSAAEIHNLCHNLRADNVTPQQFCDGCEEYQKKLFGKSPIAELRAESRERGLLLERAWVLISNAGGGEWATQGADWQKSAIQWRHDFTAKTPLL